MSTQIHGVVCAAVTVIALLCAAAVSAQESGQSYEAGVAAYEAEDYAHAKEIWLPLAGSGDTQAQYALAKLYENGGDGVMRSLTKAADWYRLAAESGLADAQNNLALLYIQGHGAPRSEERAFDLWLKAAHNGHRQAQYNVALAYYQGTGTEQDRAEAAKWFRKGAASGLTESQFALAEMYRLGVSVEENPERALYWYEQALAGGHDRARAEVEELKAAGINSEQPEEPPESTSPSSSESEEVSEPEESIEKTSENSSVLEDRETAAAEPQAEDEKQAESEPAQSKETLDTVGGRQVPTSDEETMARNLFPLGESDHQETPEQGGVKKNDSSGIKSENGPVGAVELHPRRMNQLARSRVDAETKRQGEQETGEGPPTPEKEVSAGAVPGDALSEMQADPLYEGADEAVARNEPDGTRGQARSQEGNNQQETSQEVASSEEIEKAQQEDGLARQNGNFALWLGSMRTENGARRLWNEAMAQHGRELQELVYGIREVETDDGVFLRVLATGHETRNAAQRSCEAIRASEAFCRVVTRQ